MFVWAINNFCKRNGRQNLIGNIQRLLVPFEIKNSTDMALEILVTRPVPISLYDSACPEINLVSVFALLKYILHLSN